MPILLAALALAQVAAPPIGADMAPPPEFIAAAQAFGQCVDRAVAALPAAVAPEAGARQALTACAAERTAMEDRFDAWVAGPAFPAAGRDTAREQFRVQLGAAEVEIANRIRSTRGAGTTPVPAK